MSDFTENKQGSFTVKLVSRIETFEPDKHGNIWYNVLFVGDAETFMWLAKNEPQEGKEYWGHLEKTSSGKRIRFKTDPRPDDEPIPPKAASNYETSEKQAHISRSVALNNAVNLAIVNGDDLTVVLNNAEEMLIWLNNGSQVVPGEVSSSSTDKGTQGEKSKPATIHEKLDDGWSEKDVPSDFLDD